ncbi:methyl-accepting chemotaxis protein [Denitromonas iodatirespirans]|uniref:Methyl-accepting chemotaxis protein n=1 Tax=Denitromonas iodatirespirans TaxID=2795389 RepID=A0A944DAM2_DENI1|nr:methyl-accepting chemotaxis protein [Denitromonas iodatirespirans]MBT0961506.1 methyl-accepting chemotaxis protein [Denitromonas iodatirespirans]
MFGRLTIALRLTLGFGVLLCLLLLAVALGLNRLASLEGMVERIVDVDWRKTELANDTMDLMNANTRETFLLFHAADPAPVRQRIAANVKAITALIDELDGLLYLPEGKAMLAEIRGKRKTYVDSFLEVSRMLEAGAREDASRRMASETVPALDALLASVDRLIDLQGRILEQSGAAAKASYASARNQLLAFLGVAVVLALVLTRWIVMAVTRPLGGEPDEAKAAVDTIARGDLSVDIAVRDGDTHSLLAALRTMQGNLRQMIRDLTDNANSVAGAAEQLAAASAQIASSSAHQSDAAASMASAVEQMTVSIGQVTDSAGEAREVTRDAGGLSQAGSEVIVRTVAEMEGIARTVSEAARTIQAVGDSSQRISHVVQVIREVAEQTNLLALNAAIEAARAGEQGRGFAVVADEVRKLAERTAQATTDISDMIGTMQSSSGAAVSTMEQAVKRVGDGVDLATRAGESMQAISGGTQQAVAAVNEISSALREQSVASNEIAANVERIAQMSEENSAATRQAHATAAQLQALADSTLNAVRAFRL